MSLTAAASGFVVFLLSVQVIQGQDGWGVTYTSVEICALKGSTVEMRCSYRYPSKIIGGDTTVEETFWFTNMKGNKPVDLRKHPQYAGRVQDYCENNICTLRITDLRESDSAEYKFSFITNQAIGYTGLPGVTLSVAGLQVQVSSNVAFVEQRCQSSCHLPERPSYVWYKNKKNIWTGASLYLVVSNPADTYHCAVEGYENFPSPSVYAPRLSPVSVSPSAEIVEGSSVTLTCSSDASPAATYTWYKETVKFQPSSEEPQLVFSSIQSSDSGQYYCAAENELGRTTSEVIFIDVKNAPKLLPVSVSPSGEIVEGSSVTLTCSSDASPASTYTWYKENVKFQPLSNEPQLVFSSIQSSDSGQYYCATENELERRTSKVIFIDVKHAPKLPSVSVSPSAEIVEGSSVTLTCSSDANPAAKYTWYKENQTLSQGQEGIYHFTSISSEDSGIYHCNSENMYGTINSTAVQIDVQYKSTMIMNIIRLNLVVVMLILLLLLSLWIRFRKKKTLSSSTEPNEPKETLELKSDSEYATISAVNTINAEQTEDAEEQEDLV